MPLLALGAGIVAAGVLIARALQGSKQSDGSGPIVDPRSGKPKDDGSGGATGGSGQDAAPRGAGNTTSTDQATAHGPVGNYNSGDTMIVSLSGGVAGAQITPPGYSGGPAPSPVYTLPGGYTTNYRVTNPGSVPGSAIAPGAQGRILD